jgi:hypothetical protein
VHAFHPGTRRVFFATIHPCVSSIHPLWNAGKFSSHVCRWLNPVSLRLGTPVSRLSSGGTRALLPQPCKLPLDQYKADMFLCGGEDGLD